MCAHAHMYKYITNQIDQCKKKKTWKSLSMLGINTWEKKKRKRKFPLIYKEKQQSFIIFEQYKKVMMQNNVYKLKLKVIWKHEGFGMRQRRANHDLHMLYEHFFQ